MEKLTPFFPRSQATPSKKAKKNAFLLGVACACRGCEKIEPFLLDQGASAFCISLFYFFPHSHKLVQKGITLTL
jgi:hypothetical protein